MTELKSNIEIGGLLEKGYEVGTKVVLVNTDNMHSDFKKYKGQEGIISDVNFSDNKLVEVKFTDGKKLWTQNISFFF